MKIKKIALCFVFIFTVLANQEVYAVELSTDNIVEESAETSESPHSEEVENEESPHSEEVKNGESTHSEESRSEESTHSEESQSEESTHSEELRSEELTCEEDNEYSTIDDTDDGEDIEENTESDMSIGEEYTLETMDILGEDSNSSSSGVTITSMSEDGLTTIAEILAEIYFILVVQNVIICAFLLYIMISRMISTK